MPTKYTGYIEEFFESGSEGLWWVFRYNSKEGCAPSMASINNGDFLKIFGENGEILFNGEIKEDFKAGWTEYPMQPGSGIGRPAALGFWIHWTQEGWNPDDWARLFTRELEGKAPYRAELIKKD